MNEPSGVLKSFSVLIRWLQGCIHIFKSFQCTLKTCALYCLLLLHIIRNWNSFSESFFWGPEQRDLIFSLSLHFFCRFLHVFLSLHLIICAFNKGQEVSCSVRLTTFLVLGFFPIKYSVKVKVK